MSLQTQNLSWRAGSTTILSEISIEIPTGATIGLLGPNGSGKSSLLRLLAGVRKPTSGSVILDGVNLSSMRRRHVARRVAFVEQHAQTELELTVRDVVKLGRTPHRSTWGPQSQTDSDAVDRALARVELTAMAERAWQTLSGGERQRAQIARALAQEPSELLLDEPTNHLDVHHQLDILALVKDLPMTCVMALHDLNLAAMFCDVLIVINAGQVVASGTPSEVLTPQIIAQVYRVDAHVTADGPHGRPSVRFVPRR